jgi:hypothetical protein
MQLFDKGFPVQEELLRAFEVGDVEGILQKHELWQQFQQFLEMQQQQQEQVANGQETEKVYSASSAS